MPNPRIPTALHQLADLEGEQPPPRWSWAIVGLERIGRIRLPSPALEALSAGGGREVRLRSNRLAVIVAPNGPGAVGTVDGRGRLYVPVWLRHAAAGTGAVLVGAALGEPLVVLAPPGVLDGIGDLLAGEVR
jgi:hypothetical protein